jgi:hypothetical protein
VSNMSPLPRSPFGYSRKVRWIDFDSFQSDSAERLRLPDHFGPQLRHSEFMSPFTVS